MLLLCSGILNGQEPVSSVKTKGYLLIAGAEEIVFFPDSQATPKYSIHDIEKLSGVRIIGNTSSNYDLYRINKIAPKSTGRVQFYNETDSAYSIDYNFQVLPVTATLTHSPGLRGKESGFAFELNGQKYLLRYTDNFEYLLSDIRPLYRKDLKAFNRYKE